jgi:Uma2 family endonuclease
VIQFVSQARRQRRAPRSFKWTREAYLQLHEEGFFKGSQVELIEGRIIDVPAQKNPHVIAVENARAELTRIFRRNYWVRTQATLNLGRLSLPDPDVAVVPGPRRADVDFPTEALLVVEVSDTTLWFDRERKSRIYAEANIQEYWILDLVHRQFAVRRNPVHDPSHQPRHQYASVTIHGPKERVSPLAVPSARISVVKLLP